MSEYVWKEAESRKTKASRAKDLRMEKEKDVSSLIQMVNQGMEAVPGLEELSVGPAGLCEERLEVPTDCAGMLIGKKGANLKALQERFHVTVKMETPKDGDGSTQAITVRGKCRGDVAAAIRELDVASETIEIPEEAIGWVSGRNRRYMKLIQELSGLAVLRQARRDNGSAEKGEGGDGEQVEAEAGESEGPFLLELRGKRDSVCDARLCLEAHLGYLPVFREMEEVERRLDEDLAKARGQLGYRPKDQTAGAKPTGATPIGAGAVGGRATSRSDGKGGGGKGRGRGGDSGERPSAAGKEQAGRGSDSRAAGERERGSGRGRGGRGGRA
eukprot:gnl/TRDRNA2_/TRDRNA2_51066_c0_seq1.p1 gnl/TRDRNA2_/TRDRNA2_51066_c0~~gnl/TRDRNA2_/TRDRNA2_51066_c0_seq1.p1  ORF type:complete len:329 (+),score=85.75 gnl/TRDRNA2_/TRDRNA2_51066_c0_seq1:101-1087(+)